MGRRVKHDYNALYDMYVNMLVDGKIMNMKDFSLYIGINYDLIRKWFWKIAVKRYGDILDDLGYRVKLTPYVSVFFELLRRKNRLIEFKNACLEGDLNRMARIIVESIDHRFIGRNIRSIQRILEQMYRACMDKKRGGVSGNE